MIKVNTHFRPGITAILLLLVVLPVLCALGVWQLERAVGKQALIELQDRRLQEAPALLTGTEQALDQLRYKRVQVQGRYDTDRQFLLDNQVLNGQAGFHVLTPLRIQGSHQSVLVNRGWVPGVADRNRLPPVALFPQSVSITGTISGFPGVGFKLAGAEFPAPGWPAVVQLVDVQVLANRLGYPVLPYQVWLDPAEPDGYTRTWEIRRYMTPDKHRGYAFQWFALALAALLIFLWNGFRAR